MIVIAVDPIKERLAEFEKFLRKLLPEDVAISFSDPLYALKYALLSQDKIKAVFIEEGILPLSAREVAKQIRNKHKDTVLICTAGMSNNWDGEKIDYFDTCLVRPITEEAIKKAVQSA